MTYYNYVGDIIKKYRILIFIAFISIFMINTVNSQELPLFNKVITIDPGHGGRDPGTMYGSTLEKNINLEISKVLQEELIKQGSISYLIREEDKDFSKSTDYLKKRGDLKRRIEFIESKKSNIYLSIHLNWYNDYYYRGAEILYNDINPNNKLLAESLRKSLLDNNIKTRELKTTNLFLYKNTKVVGVLIECGFLSNKNDRYLLKTKKYQEKLSKAITNGVILYFNK